MRKNIAIFIAFLGFATILYFISFDVFVGVGFWFALITVPTALGAFVQVSTDAKIEKSVWRVLLLAAVWTLILLSLFLVFGLETFICIAMALPFFLPFEVLGIYLARRRLQNKPNKPGPTTLKASLLFVPLLAVALDQRIVFPLAQGALRSEIIIDAVPAKVWQQTLVIPIIQPSERIWTFSHNILGTPGPISAELEGDLRSLTWTKGVVFQEVITERVLHQRLAWDFRFHDVESLAAFDPHVSPNSEMLRVSDGFYQLQLLPDDKTLLTLETHYQTRSPFNPYLRFWGRIFLGDFHDSVLAVIKDRAEM